jgi:hypothetical protein
LVSIVANHHCAAGQTQLSFSEPQPEVGGLRTAENVGVSNFTPDKECQLSRSNAVELIGCQKVVGDSCENNLSAWCETAFGNLFRLFEFREQDDIRFEKIGISDSHDVVSGRLAIIPYPHFMSAYFIRVEDQYFGGFDEKIGAQLLLSGFLSESYGFSSGIGRILSSLGRHFSISHTLAHVAQLPEEKPSLEYGDAKQRNREGGQPIRIIRDPLRFEGKFFVDYRFLLALALLLIGLLFGVLSGEYFYRERYLIGAALVGCGWLCGLFALGGWLL